MDGQNLETSDLSDIESDVISDRAIEESIRDMIISGNTKLTENDIRRMYNAIVGTKTPIAIYAGSKILDIIINDILPRSTDKMKFQFTVIPVFNKMNGTELPPMFIGYEYDKDDYQLPVRFSGDLLCDRCRAIYDNHDGYITLTDCCDECRQKNAKTIMRLFD